MYPFLRLGAEFLRARRMPPLALEDPHESHHRCWPWDIDLFGEMNNGRILTLYDVGRLPMAMRMGLIGPLRQNGWALTMAGASVRYRRRIKTFQRFTMRSRPVCRDDRFLYLEQTMWVGKEAASNILYRSAVTDRNGIVPTARVAEALGRPDWNPEPPDWVKNWIEAEGTRIWPPII